MPPGVRPLTVGDPVIVGRYLLLGRLGVGGMGVVYLAEHPQGGVVALKTPHPGHLHDAVLRARFAEEVRLSRRVVPFCTAAVVEDGTDRDRPYLVCEYIPGPALSQVMASRGPLPPDLAYGVALGVAAALVAVHEAGLVHRDLKPGNVLLSDAGPRLIDFGIARDVDTLAAHTQAGQVMGSPGWVAPERLTGGPALPASDVFSWGCLVAYAATGHHPFGAGEADMLARRILVEPPRVASVPALLRPVVEASLVKDPARRPRATELLGALLAAVGVGVPWDPRQAVADVLAEIWTPVPHPPAAGRPWSGTLAPSYGNTRDGTPAPAGDRPSVPVRVSRRAESRGRANLAQAALAALATVSMAALTVAAATRGGIRVDAGPEIPGRVPDVAPTHETGAGRASRAALPPGTGSRTARPAVTPSVEPATVLITATQTVSVSPLNGEDEEPHQERPHRPRETEGPPAQEDPRGCAEAGARSGGDCPATSATSATSAADPDSRPDPRPDPRPDSKPSFTQIPQAGEGESPVPSAAPSTTAATAAASPSAGPSLQIGE
ncbi:protein kinase [Streptosporangium sp. NPDC051022]|uniref:serine/threonine-protein kinase n=1 Tax=Streptosporangium sp. NPDC051022 TaxID=3155752 RepID=UPI00343C43B2